MAAPGRSDPDAELARLFKGRPVRHFLAKSLLAYAKARVRDRENLRFERTRIFGFARRVFLAIGRNLSAIGALAEPNDVFLLTVDEALGAAEGSAVTANLRGIADVRRRERDAQSRQPDPPERILQRGSVIDAASRLTLRAEAPSDHDATERRGVACGGGSAAGRARVIQDPANEQVLPGEILVARHTDPGWISHFASAAAVVAERGSVLSHSAIVSRELGIPCVVAVARACSWIRTGELIEVDGSSGYVRKRGEP
jgi:pyruvate,water dikinase